MKFNVILPLAGVMGGVYSAGFLFGYNYHRRFSEEDEESRTNPSPPANDIPPPAPDKPVETFSTNTLIYKYGLPVAGPTLHYANHVLLYDQVRRIPRWVAETLTEDSLRGDANRRHSKFTPDPNLPTMFSAGNEDFKAAGRGWSRGHMAPAGNNKQSQDAMDQSFFLSNILPQNYDNNAGFWNRLEMYCRELTKRWNEVHVISGPALRPVVETDPNTGQENKYVKYRVVGDKEVAIPTHLFKIILCQGKKLRGSDESDPDASDFAIGGFMVPNEGISWSKDLRDFQFPVAEIERVSGLNFYPGVDKQRTVDLCQADSCKLIKHDEFQLWIISRQLSNAKSEEQLKAAWKKLTKQNLQPDDYFLNLFESKCLELGLKSSDVKEVREEVATAGG